jgi:hypothetical protein
MANQSVERFRKLTKDLQKEVHDVAVDRLHYWGQELARIIALVAPRLKGELVHTIRMVPGKTDTVIRVVEGGQSTIKDGYNYPRADEFGTIHMAAKPHFFPSYRLLKPKARSDMRRKISASIKKRSAE